MDRRAIAVRGIVQGVGFRPYVFGLASRLHLHGFIKNRTGEVLIEVEGASDALDRFLRDLTTTPPPLARIDEVRWSSLGVLGEESFRIEASESGANERIALPPDIATCEECLEELFDPRNRRYRYPFLNCTNCGPRFTIITGSPYDRERTTMAPFAMCAECRAEYHDPGDRRFHAQPSACPACGPRLCLRDAEGREITDDDPIVAVASALRRGGIVAVKGLGGYHLACLATDDDAVRELRRRKQRDEKPFAVMVADLESVRQLCRVSAAEGAVLGSPRRPIVLLERRQAAGVAEGVCLSRNPRLGVMLPYTPLHHLLMRELDGVPLVMTSGNRSDEPIAYEDEEARTRLAVIADLVLSHDRAIRVRCDDSVTLVVGGIESPRRRSRGDAPSPLRLPVECRQPTLALGGQLKATFALGRGPHAFLSQHLGDLDHYEAFRAYSEAIAHFERLFEIRPELIVHDLHPDYASTRYATSRAEGCPTIAVQHHHAHMASGMAEHGLDEPVIGVAFDGTGLGTDGTIWGGEFLVGDYRSFRRAGHLRPVAMPGGEQAVREPWRMATAYLADAGLGRQGLLDGVPETATDLVGRMIERGVNAPITSSAGRLFDGVAALIGVRQRVSYEGQAAVELEWLASEAEPDGAYPFGVGEGRGPASFEFDTRVMIAAVAADACAGVDASRIARRFHSTVVEMIARACLRLREEEAIDAVVLSGGVFLNAIISAEAGARLAGEGFRVFRHRLVPPNDGGLSLGQLAIAAALGVN